MARRTRKSGDDTGPRTHDHESQARALLHGQGLRCTAPRLAVLSTLARAESGAGHLTISAIHQQLVEAGRKVDVTTVYRTVSTLVDLGVLHALSVDDRATTYGLAHEPHHHAVCTRCGRIIEVPAERLTTALAHASIGSQFALSDRAGLTLRGLCPDCQPPSAATSPPLHRP
ncbi:transcriptional repressor [Gordonia sp. TBRC 11910]|uniref:Transcriptional repressor n=1 Tax=Gordonia asplenii TaxID=2725283 RepID=A0A848KW56_9ACTN|nr:Fur family transcriptional regulator [Gordonia asplenii]NMO02820.1 transcriptional repressor [Gordonia asplenii]